MTKRYLFLFVLVLSVFFLSDCKEDEIMFPDIAGTWNWVITFTTNTCDATATQEGIAVVTQNDSGTDTTTGTMRIYLSSDTSLTCPLWTFNYSLNSSGNLIINQTLQFDPQQCSTNPSPDTMGDMQMNMMVTEFSMSGTFSGLLYDSAQTWSCTQAGDISLDRQQ